MKPAGNPLRQENTTAESLTFTSPAGSYDNRPADAARCAAPSVLQDYRELWDIYTLKEEYLHPEKNASKSFFSGRDPERLLEPAVSKYLYGKSPSIDYPDGKRFGVCLSHDIDVIYPPLAHRVFSSVHYAKHGNMDRLVKEITWRKGGKNAYDYKNFRDIMAIEEQYGARSSFFFLTADRNIQRFRMYDIGDVENELGYIADRGWEVGLHGGYYAYNDADAIKREKAKLEKVLGRKVTGYRNHYLRFQVPDTWEYLSEAGFKYNTTLGYNNVPGFRNGMCQPFRPFNLNTGREVDILEIPLTIMDCALFAYAGTAGKAWEIAKQLIDAAERYRGVVTLLWHNDVFHVPYRREWMALYHKMLKYCQEKNAWLTDGAEIARLCEGYVR